MLIKSKAPFRIGLAGGGTDVEPYLSMFGGEVVNATIGLYARTLVETTNDGMFYAEFKGLPPVEYTLGPSLPLSRNATDLITATYNRFCKDFGSVADGLIIQVSPDVPIGSGLGTSSTIVVSLCGAFLKLYGLDWSPAAIADYAFSIEREDLGWPGGKQDQYAAVHGGFNHFSFRDAQQAEVERLRLSSAAISMLEQSLVLYHTRQERHSASIIAEQQQHILGQKQEELKASHQLRQLALDMADALRTQNLPAIGRLLHTGFMNKKKISSGISTPHLDEIYKSAIAAGATGGKISGAGGGGFILFYTPPSKRVAVQNALAKFEGQEYPFYFTDKGLVSWKE